MITIPIWLFVLLIVLASITALIVLAIIAVCVYRLVRYIQYMTSEYDENGFLYQKNRKEKIWVKVIRLE